MCVTEAVTSGAHWEMSVLCCAKAHVQLLICSVEKQIQSVQLARHFSDSCAFIPQAEDESPMYV